MSVISTAIILFAEADFYFVLIVLGIILVHSIIFFKTITITASQIIFTRVLNPFVHTIVFEFSEISCVECKYFYVSRGNPLKYVVISTNSKQIKLYIQLTKEEGKELMDKLMENNIRVKYPLYIFD